jgi:CRISPR-associated protein Csb1
MTITQSDSKPVTVNVEMLNDWATNPAGPVALHLKQRLVSVESTDDDSPSIIYPPTYADIGYNIDTLSDGTRVALIDSVGSHANRLEPIFISSSEDRNEWLVPQIDIVLHEEPCGECENCKKAAGVKKRKAGEECSNPHKEKRSLLELAHRSADAVVRSSPTLLGSISKAFQKLRQTGDAGPLCAIAPTSLVFGVWDSRGEGEKRPRLVRSIIRAWDVDVLHAAAQFNSVWKGLDKEQRDALEKEGKAKKVKLSVKGLKDAPSIFRDTKVPEYMSGAVNPEARVLGGIQVRDRIERDVTVNLVALRGIRGSSTETAYIQKYLLGLSLFAATSDIDLFLREGCHLRYTGDDAWNTIQRRGNPTSIDLASDAARKVIRDFAVKAAGHFRKSWPQDVEHRFDLDEAKKLLAKADETETTDSSK